MVDEQDQGASVRDTLLALADRCEAAAGPDRELDDGIAAAIFRYSGMSQLVGVPDSGQFRTFTYSNGSIGSSLRYSDSLDAAMTLVPEGWGWLVSQPNAKAIASGLLKEATPVMGEVQYGYERRWTVAAATPALALAAAALRARAAMGDG